LHKPFEHLLEKSKRCSFFIPVHQAVESGSGRCERHCPVAAYEEKRYIENAEVGRGLLIADKVVVPFNNTFPQDTGLFRLMDTNPNSSKQKAPIKSL
jgi:hypothetical protein